jgi:CheY-like chemotaxis protein
MTIFIVEDDKPLRETFADVLRQVGYRVAAAGNGREALERIRADRPSFIFVDLVMPIMNGFELIQALKADDDLSTIPVAAMTASGTTVVPGVLLMKKPFRTEAAVALIEMYSATKVAKRRRATPKEENVIGKPTRTREAMHTRRKGQPRAPRVRRSTSTGR